VIDSDGRQGRRRAGQRPACPRITLVGFIPRPVPFSREVWWARHEWNSEVSKLSGGKRTGCAEVHQVPVLPEIWTRMPAFDWCFRWDHKAHPHLVARRLVSWSSCLSRLQAKVKSYASRLQFHCFIGVAGDIDRRPSNANNTSSPTLRRRVRNDHRG